MTIKVRYTVTPEKEQSFNTWLKSISGLEADGDIKLLLWHDYFFAKGWLQLIPFVKEHNGVRIRNWPEVKYLLRDIVICDLMLRRLDVEGRRNLLAALQGFSTDIEIARALGFKSSSQVKAFHDLQDQPKSYPDSIRLFAMLYDVMDEHINDEKTLHLTNHYNNYHHYKAGLMSDFHFPKTGSSLQNYFWIQNDLPFFKEENLYARLKKTEAYQALEVYNLDEDSVEVYDFRSCLDPAFSKIVITPAILRNVKKVIYFRPLGNNDEKLQKYLEELRLRKYTKVVT